jgi:hypothetical protein
MLAPFYTRSLQCVTKSLFNMMFAVLKLKEELQYQIDLRNSFENPTTQAIEELKKITDRRINDLKDAIKLIEDFSQTVRL